MYSIVLLNFRLAVPVTVVGCIALSVLDPALSINSGALEADAANFSIASLWLVAATTLVLWFAQYRKDDGHVLAFFVGFGLLALMVASQTTNALGNSHYGTKELLFLLYAGVSHIAYALLEWQELFHILGGDAD